MSEARSQERFDPAARWLEGVVLAACYGFVVFLLTGDRATSVGVAGFLVGVATLLFVLVPRRVDVPLPLMNYYLRVLVVLSLPLIVMKLGHTRTAWYDLQGVYGTTAPAPGPLEAGHDIVITRSVSEFTVKRYPFRRVSAAFVDEAAHLVQSWPMRLVSKPLRVPVRSISRCGKEERDPSYTSLFIGDLGFWIAVYDHEGRVLDWCRRRGIAEGSGESL